MICCRIQHREQSDGPDRLSADTQCFPARGQDAQPGARPQQCVSQDRAVVDQMLAVVQYSSSSRGLRYSASRIITGRRLTLRSAVRLQAQVTRDWQLTAAHSGAP